MLLWQISKIGVCLAMARENATACKTLSTVLNAGWHRSKDTWQTCGPHTGMQTQKCVPALKVMQARLQILIPRQSKAAGQMWTEMVL